MISATKLLWLTNERVGANTGDRCCYPSLSEKILFKFFSRQPSIRTWSVCQLRKRREKGWDDLVQAKNVISPVTDSHMHRNFGLLLNGLYLTPLDQPNPHGGKHLRDRVTFDDDCSFRHQKEHSIRGGVLRRLKADLQPHQHTALLIGPTLRTVSLNKKFLNRRQIFLSKICWSHLLYKRLYCGLEFFSFTKLFRLYRLFLILCNLASSA